MNRLARIAPAIVFVTAALLTANLRAAPAQASTSQTYLVLYKGNTVAANAIAQAGGTLMYSYDSIGVAVAQSSNPSFAADVARDNRIEGAAATARFATKLDDDADADSNDVAQSAPATDSDNLSGLQWDMVQIHAPEAHAITGGSPTVVVGDIDTGLDYTHPDLAPNVDFANSVSCVGGVPNQAPAAWNDDNGHGTHTAGTIAAASNGIGIVGVAPNVKIAGIKASTAGGFLYPEAIVCAFVWAGSHHIDVTNNSYFADPWLFNCRNDAGQRAIWKAEQRAIRYAMQQGVVVVAAEGNNRDDLSHPVIDRTSPDDTTPIPREVTNACLVIPAEVSGVVGVTADGNLAQKASYSNYGVSTADLVAPGGDTRQRTAAAPNGRVLSTYPAALNPGGSLAVFDCSVSPCASYRYLTGTSMASPHVAGVVALIVSQRKVPPGAVQAKLSNTADPRACPPNPYLFPAFPRPSGDPQTCEGGIGHNSFYGSGQVNALTAVSQ